jgi:SAM-dependent methyltransferase
VDPAFHGFQHDVEDWHFWYQVRRSLLQALLDGQRLPANARLLDVGCGTGGNSLALAPFGRVVGVDRASNALCLGRERPYASRVCADALHLPFRPASFDAVVALDLLEHLDDDLAGIVELGRVLRPGGLLVAFVPALDILWSYNDDFSHHRRRYTRGQFRARLEAAGLSVQRLTYFNTVLFLPILGIRLLAGAAKVQRRYEHEARPGLLNDFARALFGLEIPWLRRRDFPIGVSLAAVARRPT